MNALLIANEFLEDEVKQLQAAVSHAYVRGRFKAEAMENEKNHERSNVHYVKRPKRLVSRTRLVMGLLLIVAIPIFIGLANKAVREDAEAIHQVFGR